ncbi:MAG TPA: hypothetical protein PKK06_12315 [Phycisphaerae bacterium]|nr:hypothetical protein [Phycisphaerae bacterium]HNU47041.1 hypothetical protein [Phycisphaerae bacterium]
MWRVEASAFRRVVIEAGAEHAVAQASHLLGWPWTRSPRDDAWPG